MTVDPARSMSQPGLPTPTGVSPGVNPKTCAGRRRQTGPAWLATLAITAWLGGACAGAGPAGPDDTGIPTDDDTSGAGDDTTGGDDDTSGAGDDTTGGDDDTTAGDDDTTPTSDDTTGEDDDTPQEVEHVPGSVDADPTAAVFDVDVVHDVALEMTESDWADIRDNPWAKNWHPATVRWLGEESAEAGVRAFGTGSLIAGKPSLKVSFDHYVAGRKWRGLEQVKLDNASQDVGFMNERVGTAVLRRMGVPAVRTGWARVSVNGDPAGFFVVLESVDDVFLGRWFDTSDGHLYATVQGHWGQGLNPMDDPLTFYEPQTASGGDGTDLQAVAEVVATGSDADLGALVDLEGFTRQSVARSVMGSMDAFSADGNNFYLYDDAGWWRIVPWDLDVDLGGYYFTQALAVDPEAPWLTSPWCYNPVTGAPYTDPVLERHLAIGVDTRAIVDEMLAGPMAWETVDADVQAAAALIRDDVHADVLGYGPAFDQRADDLRLWLHSRLSALAGGEVAPCAPFPDGALPASALSPAGTVGWGSLRVDATDWGPGFTVSGEHYCTGLFAHAPSRVDLDVPAGYAVLRGKAGLQDWVQQCGDGASFRVEQAGETLWEAGPLRSYDEALDLGDVPVVAGALRLVAAPLGEYSCDTAAWLDLRVEEE